MGISESAFNEMRDGSRVREAYTTLDRWLGEVPPERLVQRRDEADRIFRRRGITFAVYGDNSGAERLIPFDVIICSPMLRAQQKIDEVEARRVLRQVIIGRADHRQPMIQS